MKTPTEPRPAVCPTCDGTGYVKRTPGQGLEPCPTCEAFGFILFIDAPYWHTVGATTR
jgi:hypothetical protein